MNSRFLPLALLTAYLGAPLIASAQDSRAYVGGSIGLSQTKLNTAPLIAGGATVQSKETTDPGWKAFGGFKIDRNFGLELSYVNLGKYKINGHAGASSFSANAKVDGVALTLVGTIPVAKNIDVFAKAGGVSSRARSAAVATIAPTNNEHDVSWTFGIGAQYHLNERVAMRLEAEHYSLGRNGSANLYSLGGQYKFY